MRIGYSDESGMGNIQREPVTVVTAIVINVDRDWDDIERDLGSVRLHAPDYLLEAGRVLKGKKFYGLLRKDAEVHERDLSEVVARQIEEEADQTKHFLHQVLAVLIKYRIPIFYGAVDRQGLINYQQLPNVSVEEKTVTPYDIAFSECLGRLDSAVFTFTNERLLWIADRSDTQREPATRSGLSFYRSQQVTSISRLLGKPEDQFRISIADTVYFGHSSESVALQLADVCCSTITNFLLEQFYGRTYCASDYYSVIRKQVLNDGAPVILRP